MTQGPLAGITVLDLTRVLAGPYCTMLLADLGARVIKVERPNSGDDSRAIGPFIDDTSAYFASLNRGKQSIALDLKADADRAIFERLLERADVLVENFRPGTMEKLGYGWDGLHARLPRLIYAAASGFGQTGPYAGRPAYDVVVQGMGGIMSVTGPPGGPPTRVGTSIGDISAGLFTTIGVTTALYHRAQTGVGQCIDVSMLDCQVAMLENALARFQATGETPGPLGTRHPSITPFAAFETADGNVVVAAGNDRLFESLCATLGRPELAADPRFSTNDDRTRNEPALRKELESTLRTRPTSHWLSALETAGVPCGPVNDVADVFEDPQVAARNMLLPLDDPDLPDFRVAGNPIKLSGFPDGLQRPATPKLDADREALLAELDAARPGDS
jgi:CoA:oxalate CoA-transferase